tara:strand:- start:5406 stop:6176 length:771 start_codon:yes stop_codon:yes gene_type:complete
MVRLAGRVAEAGGGAGGLIQAFKDQLREQTLASNRSKPIGAGEYGVVYSSDVPGNVIKQSSDYNSNMEAEANLQAIAAEMGIAPKVAGLETFRGGIGNRIEMEDITNNFETRGDTARSFPTGMDAVRVNQQLGQLALKGIRLEDRHNANVVYNKMTGRPMQLDFGIAGKIEGSEQAAWLSHVTAEGFEAAGIPEVGGILRATVMDLLEGGDVKDAMDVAKQGFSRLQKIRKVHNPVDQLVDKVKKESDLFDVISPY